MGSVLNMPDCRERCTQEKNSPMPQALNDARREFACQRDELLAVLDEPLRC